MHVGCVQQQQQQQHFTCTIFLQLFITYYKQKLNKQQLWYIANCNSQRLN